VQLNFSLQTHRLTPYGQHLKESLHYASQNTPPKSSETTTHITQHRDNQVFMIDLEAGTYTCRRYQDSSVPCDRAMRAIQRKDNAPIARMASPCCLDQNIPA
jgi:hypothetical protein